MTITINERKFRTEKKAPEGGWGYLVGIGMALPFACIWGTMSAFGLMFNDFLANLGKGTSTVTIITGTNFSATSFAALFASTFYRKFSIRSVGLVGGTLYFLGSLMTVFAFSVEHLIISYGILQGTGTGLIVSVSYTTFNYYFVEKRVFMLSLAKSLMGVGVMLYPLLAQFLMSKYGFRGAMAVLAAINAHAILGMMVMHPIAWHYKRVKIPIEETKPLMDSNDKESEVTIAIPPNDANANANANVNAIELSVASSKSRKVSRVNINVPKDGLNEGDEGTSKTIKAQRERKKSFHRALSMLSQTEFDLVEGENETVQDKAYRERKKSFHRALSILSQSDFDGAIRNLNTEAKKKGTWGTGWKKVVDFLDLSLLKDWIYVNIVLGISFALYSDNLFFTLQPMYLLGLDYEKEDTARIIAIGSGADLSSRICLAIMSLCFQINPRYLYLAGAIAIICLRFVFYSILDYNGMVAITAVIGFFRTWVHVPLALILADHLPKERFASGYGLYMFIQGNLSFLIGPIIGFIRDYTKSYIICFHSLTLMMCLCVIPWILEIVYLRIYPKKNKN